MAGELCGPLAVCAFETTEDEDADDVPQCVDLDGKKQFAALPKRKDDIVILSIATSIFAYEVAQSISKGELIGEC